MSSFADISSTARAENRVILTEQESKTVLKAINIPITEPVLATNSKEAANISSDMGFPVALKIASQDITHKSDVGGVRLGIDSQEEIAEVFDQMINTVKKEAKGSSIDGITVQPMAPPGGVEVIIGVTRDHQFGPVIMFGLGGIAVEILQDVSFRIAPLTPIDAEEMIKEIKGYKMLTGYRSFKPANMDKLKDLLLKVSDLAMKESEISEMDLNPVFAYENDVVAADARIILTES